MGLRLLWRQPLMTLAAVRCTDEQTKAGKQWWEKVSQLVEVVGAQKSSHSGHQAGRGAGRADRGLVCSFISMAPGDLSVAELTSGLTGIDMYSLAEPPLAGQ